MAKNLILGPILAQIWVPIFFSWLLPLLDVRHCCKLSMYAVFRKTNVGSFDQNLSPQIFFSWVLSLLDVRHCRKLSLYAISRKTNDPNSRKWRKTSFWVWFRPVGPKFGPRNFFFFFKNLFLELTLGLLSKFTFSRLKFD